MPNTFTLDNLRSTLEAKYGPVVLEDFPGEGGPIRLLPMLRLPKDRRAELSKVMAQHASEGRARDAAQAAGETAPEEGDESATDLNQAVDRVEELLTLVLERKSDIDRIKVAFDDDGQALLMLWEKYQAVTQPGDPSPSES